MRAVAAAFALLLALGASPALATTVVAMEVEDLAREADRAVRGTVRSVEARVTGGQVHTFVTLEVSEEIFGAPAGASSPTVSLRLRGGVAGDLGQQVPGTPSLSVGDDVVLFLNRNRADPELHHLVGLAQSVWRVRPGPEGPVVVRDLEGLARARQVDGGYVLLEGGSGAETPMTLDALKDRIRAARAP